MKGAVNASEHNGQIVFHFCPEIIRHAKTNFRMNDNNFTPQQPKTGFAEPMPARQSPPPNKKKKKKKHSLPFRIFKKIIAVIATTLLSLFLVMIITGTIVATALTVYVLDFMDESSSITFQALESGSDTYFYGTEFDENGEEKIVQLHRVKSSVQRIPVSIDKIPQHVRDTVFFGLNDGIYRCRKVDLFDPLAQSSQCFGSFSAELYFLECPHQFFAERIHFPPFQNIPQR